MLMPYERFIHRYGVKSAVYVSTPKINLQTDIQFPRNTVIHFLDQTTDIRFPNRNMYYLSGVENSKKVKVMHITDLVRKVGTSTLNNRFADREVRQWRTSHRKTFKFVNLIEDPNREETNTGIVNYNLIKDLYNYQSTVFEVFNYNYNIMTTFVTKLNEFLQRDRISNNLISIPLPNYIPGPAVVRKLLKYDDAKFSRSIQEVGQYWIIELYKWMTLDNRPSSLFKDITDDQSKRVTIEFKFRGYSTFIPLSVLRGFSQESKLESAIKLPEERLKKFFLVFLIRLQKSILDISTVDRNTLGKLDEDVDPEGYDEAEDAMLDDEDKDYSDEVLYNPKDAYTEPEEEDFSELGDEPKTKTKNPFLNRKKKDDFLELDDLDNEDYISTVNDNDIFKELDSYDNYDEVKFEEKDDIKGSIAEQIRKYDTNEDVLEDKAPEVSPEEDEVVEEEVTDVEEHVINITPEEKKEILTHKSRDQIVEDYIKEGEKYNTLTSAEIKSIRKSQQERARLLSPFSTVSIDEETVVGLEPIELKEDIIKLNIKNENVTEELKVDKIKKFDSEYIEKVLHKDIVSSVLNLENAGVIITDYSVEEKRTVVDAYEIHKVTFKPLRGKPSTVIFRIPIVDEDGVYMVGGIKYRMKKQRQDLPIRKVNSTRVGVTSNYGKFFVDRTARVAYDSDKFIIRSMIKDYLGPNETIVKLVPGKKRLNSVKGLPNLYFSIMSNYDKIITRENTFILNEHEIDSALTPQVKEKIAKSGDIFIGVNNKTQEILVLNKNEEVINYNTKEVVGPLEALLGADLEKIPKSFSTIKVLGTDIPFGVCMAYYMGLSKLIGVTDTKYKVIPKNKRYKPTRNEIEIRFLDTKLVLEADTEEKKLIFAGFAFYRDFLKNYKMNLFDHKDIYLPLVQFRGCELYHLKELDVLEQLFLDPITVDVLEQMGEPTEFRPLLFRANQMLTDYSHPDINDPTFSRIRGYDRFPGLMYKALSESVRDYLNKGRANSKIELDPYKVWSYITRDQTKEPISNLNPAESIRASEIVTLVGRDGLRTDAIPAELRRYHKNDAGLVSEGTADSSNVAIASYLSPYAKITNIRGMVDPTRDELNETPAKLFSTPVQTAAFAEYDDKPHAIKL